MNPLKRTLLFSLTASALVFGSSLANAEEYSFKLENKTKQVIKQLLVSQDKKTWGKFDIGAGLAPGSTSKLVWDKSTNNQSCEQWVKAVYADGEESEPEKFDFCEKDLEIEFEE